MSVLFKTQTTNQGLDMVLEIASITVYQWNSILPLVEFIPFDIKLKIDYNLQLHETKVNLKLGSVQLQWTSSGN